MTETHTLIKTWREDEFPFEKDELDDVHKVLPQGYWIAKDYSADEELLCLMSWDRYTEDN